MPKPSLRLASLLTLAAFVLHQVVPSSLGLAAPEVPVQTSFEITIPSDLGTLETVISGSGPAIVHLQEVHGDPTTQKNIQKILQHLKKQYGFDLVLLEGSAFKLRAARARFFPKDSARTMQILAKLREKGIASGAELFLAQEEKAEGYGIEEAGAYRENSRAFVAVHQARQESEAFLKEMQKQTERLTASYFNKALRNYLSRERAFESAALPLEDWLKTLKAQAQTIITIDLENPEHQIEWPMLVRIFKLREFESRLDLAKFEKERADFFRKIEGAGRKLQTPGEFKKVFEEVKRLLHSTLAHAYQLDPETGLLFEKMVSYLPQNFPYQNYPNVNIFIGHLILQSELEAEAMMNEIRALADQIAEKLAATDKEKQILALLKKVRLLKKLFALELTSADEGLLQKDPSGNEYRPSDMIQSFRVLNDGARVRNGEFKNTTAMDALYEKAVEFYRWARKRDSIMIGNVEKRLAQTGKNKAVVITGGFHSGPFQEWFGARGYNYALVSPKISQAPDSSRYIQSILQSYRDFSTPAQSTLMNIPQIMTSRAEARLLSRDLSPVLKLVRSEIANSRSELRMLVLRRQVGEAIMISDNIVVTIVYIRGDKVSIGIEAPKEVPVHRGEVFEELQREAERIKNQEEAKKPDQGGQGPIRSEARMLVFSRKLGESIMIGDNIEVQITEIKHDKVQIGIEAPKEVPVYRREVYKRIKAEEARKPDQEGQGPTRSEVRKKERLDFGDLRIVVEFFTQGLLPLRLGEEAIRQVRSELRQISLGAKRIPVDATNLRDEFADYFKKNPLLSEAFQKISSHGLNKTPDTITVVFKLDSSNVEMLREQLPKAGSWLSNRHGYSPLIEESDSEIPEKKEITLIFTKSSASNPQLTNGRSELRAKRKAAARTLQQEKPKVSSKSGQINLNTKTARVDSENDILTGLEKTTQMIENGESTIGGQEKVKILENLRPAIKTLKDKKPDSIASAVGNIRAALSAWPDGHWKSTDATKRDLQKILQGLNRLQGAQSPKRSPFGKRFQRSELRDIHLMVGLGSAAIIGVTYMLMQVTSVIIERKRLHQEKQSVQKDHPLAVKVIEGKVETYLRYKHSEYHLNEILWERVPEALLEEIDKLVSKGTDFQINLNSDREGAVEATNQPVVETWYRKNGSPVNAVSQRVPSLYFKIEILPSNLSRSESRQMIAEKEAAHIFKSLIRGDPRKNQVFIRILTLRTPFADDKQRQSDRQLKANLIETRLRTESKLAGINHPIHLVIEFYEEGKDFVSAFRSDEKPLDAVAVTEAMDLKLKGPDIDFNLRTEIERNSGFLPRVIDLQSLNAKTLKKILNSKREALLKTLEPLPRSEVRADVKLVRESVGTLFKIGVDQNTVNTLKTELGRITPNDKPLIPLLRRLLRHPDFKLAILAFQGLKRFDEEVQKEEHTFKDLEAFRSKLNRQLQKINKGYRNTEESTTEVQQARNDILAALYLPPRSELRAKEDFQSKMQKELHRAIHSEKIEDRNQAANKVISMIESERNEHERFSHNYEELDEKIKSVKWLIDNSEFYHFTYQKISLVHQHNKSITRIGHALKLGILKNLTLFGEAILRDGIWVGPMKIEEETHHSLKLAKKATDLINNDIIKHPTQRQVDLKRLADVKLQEKLEDPVSDFLPNYSTIWGKGYQTLFITEVPSQPEKVSSKHTQDRSELRDPTVLSSKTSAVIVGGELALGKEYAAGLEGLYLLYEGKFFVVIIKNEAQKNQVEAFNQKLSQAGREKDQLVLTAESAEEAVRKVREILSQNDSTTRAWNSIQAILSVDDLNWQAALIQKLGKVSVAYFNSDQFKSFARSTSLDTLVERFRREFLVSRSA